MSSIIRVKGRFMKEKVLKKRLKALSAMAEAKKKSCQAKKKSCQEYNTCIGRRIVELSELAKNLTCYYCGKDLSLKNIVNERRLGLNSILRVRCQNCSVITDVATGKIHISKNNHECSDVNTKIVLGTLINKFFP